MTVKNYRQALKDALEERSRLLAEKDEKEIRIAQLSQTIYMLRKLCGESVEAMEGDAGIKTQGLTGATRSILIAAGEPMGSLDIKNKLAEMGFPIKGNNPQAAIHTILRRLSKQQEIVAVKGDGKSAIKWSWRVVK
jgi:hypothetical protein